MADDESDRASRTSCSRSPERGSATELMDHGAAGDELGPMRHSAAHVLAEAVLDLFPGTKLGIGPVITDGFYYDFLLPRPLTPGRPAGHRGADARVDRGGPPVRALGGDAGGRAGGAGRARPAVQGRDRRRPRRGRRARRHADAADDLLPAGPVHRPVPRPARRQHRQDRPVQAPRHGRRVLARRREAPDAPARLRHGLGDAGGPRRLPVAPRGGEEARPPPARRRSSTCSRSTTSRRARRSGIPRASASGARSRARCASCRRGAATRRSRRRSSSSERALAAVRPLGPLRARTCSSSSPRSSSSASSR